MATGTATTSRRASALASARKRLDTVTDPAERAILESDLIAAETSAETALNEKLEGFETYMKANKTWADEVTKKVESLSSANSLSEYFRTKTGDFLYCFGLMVVMVCGGASGVIWMLQPPKVTHTAENYCIPRTQTLVILQPDGSSVSVPGGSCVTQVHNPRPPPEPEKHKPEDLKEVDPKPAK